MPWKVSVQEHKRKSTTSDQELVEYYYLAESPEGELWIKPALHIKLHSEFGAKEMEFALNEFSLKLGDDWTPDYSDMKTNSW